MTPQRLRAEALCTGYGKLQVLRDVSIAVDDGKTLAVLGSNGAGKTTLVRALVGLIAPWSGKIYYDGGDISRVGVEARARRGIVLAPEGRGIFASLSVEENLVLGARPACLRSRSTAAVQRRLVSEGLERAYALFPVLAERRRQSGAALSGGEQQMLALARALMAQPVVLLLDEPSLGLAPQIVHAVYEALGALRRNGQTMVLVEESIERSLAFADSACVLKNGQVFASGSAAEIAHNPNVTDAYLGTRIELEDQRS
jgi:branched-chain amino acid transport system ATP-binding protein